MLIEQGLECVGRTGGAPCWTLWEQSVDGDRWFAEYLLMIKQIVDQDFTYYSRLLLIGRLHSLNLHVLDRIIH